MNTALLAIMFLNATKAFDLPPKLLDSMCYVESRHDINAIHEDDGGTDSLGVCQVKLSTAQWLGFTGDAQDLMDPETNIFYAAKYLSYQHRRYRNVERALVAYNKGNAKNLQSSEYSAKVIKQWGTATSGQIQFDRRRTAGI